MALIGRHDFASVAERGRLEAEAVHQPLDFGSILTGTEDAGGMSGKVQRENVTTQRIDTGRSRADFHPRLQRCVAGGLNSSTPIGLHKANAATAFGRKLRLVAKRRDIDACPAGALEDSFPLLDGNRLVIDCGGLRCHSRTRSPKYFNI